MDEPEPIDEDPEVAALLNFTPVPRARTVPGSWTPELQRELIARLAVHGSIEWACKEMDKDRTGVTRLFNNKQAGEFRAARDSAIALAKRRLAEVDALVERMEPDARSIERPATIDYRRKRPLEPRADGVDGGSGAGLGGGLPGQVLNEHGEWEDEGSYARRTEEAIDSIGMKLVRCRRGFLRDISGCPAKRAAFEILTELPVDWDKAERLEPQEFEPWTRTNQRQPDMVLTAESGWTLGEHGYGPDRKAELLAEINAWRAERGLEPVSGGADRATNEAHEGAEAGSAAQKR